MPCQPRYAPSWAAPTHYPARATAGAKYQSDPGFRVIYPAAIWSVIALTGVLAYWHGNDIKLVISVVGLLPCLPILVGSLIGHHIALRNFLKDGDLKVIDDAT